MSPLVVRALRRLASIFVGLAVILVLVFRVLPALGVLGPSPEERIGEAEQAIETARAYGAGPGQTAFDRAVAGVAEARGLTAKGERQGARRTAIEARQAAVEAQRVALVQRAEDRRRSQRVVEEIDALLNGLEAAHSELARGAERTALSQMLSVMKKARSTGAALLLAYEQGNYRRVLEEEAAVKQSLEEAKLALEAARRGR